MEPEPCWLKVTNADESEDVDRKKGEGLKSSVNHSRVSTHIACTFGRTRGWKREERRVAGRAAGLLNSAWSTWLITCVCFPECVSVFGSSPELRSCDNFYLLYAGHLSSPTHLTLVLFSKSKSCFFDRCLEDFPNELTNGFWEEVNGVVGNVLLDLKSRVGWNSSLKPWSSFSRKLLHFCVRPLRLQALAVALHMDLRTSRLLDKRKTLEHKTMVFKTSWVISSGIRVPMPQLSLLSGDMGPILSHDPW